MKKIIVITLILAVVLTLALVPTRTADTPMPVDTQTSTPQTENTNIIKLLDTSTWQRVQLHQDISVLIPTTWTGGSDGIYNYDYKMATGIRDPNFPDNSFKCVFYGDTELRSNIDIKSEQTLNTEPKITYINAEWIDKSEESLRALGEEISLYSYDAGSREMFVECNVFKGVLQGTDRRILENVLLTVE